MFGCQPDSLAPESAPYKCDKDEKGTEGLEEEQEHLELVEMMRTLIRKEKQAFTLFFLACHRFHAVKVIMQPLDHESVW